MSLGFRGLGVSWCLGFRSSGVKGAGAGALTDTTDFYTTHVVRPGLGLIIMSFKDQP